MKRGLVIILLIIVCSQIVLSACTDTDKGEKFNVLGVTSNKSVKTYDTCSGVDRINEAICVNGAVITLTKKCPAGLTCSLGRCISGENIPCADTDGSANQDVWGIVTYGTDTLRRDKCNVDGQLEEQICEAGMPWTIYVSCPNSLCQNGRCLIAAQNQGQPLPEAEPENEGWQPPPEAMPPEESYSCSVSEISWTDGYENNIEESGVGLRVFGLVTADNCEQEHFTLNVIDSDDDSIVEELGDFDFGFDDDAALWYNLSAWTPQTEGEYYLSATIIRDGSYSYEADNSDRPLKVTNNCMPEALPENVECALDPLTGELLPSGQDFDCDGVDDCIDQWIYAYGDDVDPDNGIPLNFDCVSDWDCTQAEWSSCTKNANGRLTRTRDITQCTLPEGFACAVTPSDEKNCIQEEQFPVFNLFNILTVSFMLIGYYLIKRKKL